MGWIPLIVAGIDPQNGDFFVAKKSAFNIKPELCYSEYEINAYYGRSQGLVTALTYCLRYFKDIRNI